MTPLILKSFLKKAHLYFYLVVVSFLFILLFPFIYYLSRRPERYRALNKVRSILGFLSSALAGIFYSVSFEEPINWSKPFILCPNHSSNLDITAMTLIAGSNYAFIGKDDLLNNYVTSLFFKTIDIPVNRDSKISSFRAFKKAEEHLRNGMNLVIFPEGKISDDFPPVLHPFKNGPFRLAIEQKIPVIPVTIKDSWKKLWDDGMKYGSRPGICHICIHKPIETLGMQVKDTDELRERVFSIIQNELKNEA